MKRKWNFIPIQWVKASEKDTGTGAASGSKEHGKPKSPLQEDVQPQGKDGWPFLYAKGESKSRKAQANSFQIPQKTQDDF